MELNTRTLQEIVSSKEVAFGMNFKQVESDDLQDFVENAELGQKWYSENEGIMYYKLMDDDNEIRVFFLASGKAVLAY